jgi:hypothetical protein
VQGQAENREAIYSQRSGPTPSRQTGSRGDREEREIRDLGHDEKRGRYQMTNLNSQAEGLSPAIRPRHHALVIVNPVLSFNRALRHILIE